MSKLTRVALATRFDEKDVDNILVIAEATGNVRTSVEMLLGIYEEPLVYTDVPDTDRQANKKFIKFDPFAEKVHYSYNTVKSKSAWFRKEEEELTKENIANDNYFLSDAAKEMGMDEDEFRDKHVKRVYHRDVSDEERFDEISLKTWNSWACQD